MINPSDYNTHFAKLNQRQDSDMLLYYLDKYVMKDPATNEAMPATDSITLNDPRTFGDSVLSVLGGDKRLFEFRGIDPKYQGIAEDIVNESLNLNDEQLADSIIEPLESCLNFFVSFRGWIGGIPLVYKRLDRYQLSVMPFDPRWAKWSSGSRGMKWGSYRVGMEKNQAEEMFKKKLTGSDKMVTLECVLDESSYSVQHVVDGNPLQRKELQAKASGLDFCPYVILPAPTQPMMIATNSDFGTALSLQGESIYAANRDIYLKLNEIASVWASINKQQFLTPLAYVGSRPFKQRPFGIGILVELQPNEQLIEIPTKEMSASAQALFGRLGIAAQQGSISSINYGSLAFEMSALAIAQMSETQKKIFWCRRKAKDMFYRKVINCWRRQIATDKCYDAEIDDEYAITITDKSAFEKKFSIRVSFTSISPEENIANYQLAQQAKALGCISQLKILTDIIHDDKPAETLREAKGEQAALMVPALSLFEAAIAYSDRNVPEERINQIKADIIFKYLMDEMKQPVGQEFAQPAQMPSQPKQEIGMSRTSSEKMAANKQKESGVINQQSARRAKETQ